jgi:sialic acid synthase SpsE
MGMLLKTKNGRLLGTGYPPYLIAEIGTNHNQDFYRAKALVVAAAESGFDCVKFQTYEPDEIVSPVVTAEDYGMVGMYGNILATEIFERHLKTPKAWFPELYELCHQHGVDCATTVHGEGGLEWAKKIGFDMIKIASMDHNNFPFLEKIVNQIDVPVLISFGMAVLEDISLAVKTLSDHAPGLGILHCVSIYPPNPEELRLANIDYFLKHFDVPVGFSDHADDVLTSVAAYALGAVIFEKHITLDRKLKGPDHAFALEPDQMVSYVNGIRALASDLKSKAFINPVLKEQTVTSKYLKSVVAMHDLPSGTILKTGDLTLVRPGTGIAPKFIQSIIGKRLHNSVLRGVPLMWSDIDT